MVSAGNGRRQEQQSIEEKIIAAVEDIEIYCISSTPAI